MSCPSHDDDGSKLQPAESNNDDAISISKTHLLWVSYFWVNQYK